jgi:hypothetical protein
MNPYIILHISTQISNDNTGNQYVPLDHKVGNDAVEDATLVVEGLARRAHSLFASAKGSEVIDGLGNRVAKKTHDHTASFGRAFDLNVKENLVGDLLTNAAQYKRYETSKLAKHSTRYRYRLHPQRCEHPISRVISASLIAGAFDITVLRLTSPPR